MANWKKIMMASSGGGSYWLNELTPSTSVASFTGMNLLSTGDPVVVGKQENGTYDNIYVARVSTDDGSVTWSKAISFGYPTGQTLSNPRDPAVDGSDNIYICHDGTQSGSSYISDWAIEKVSSSGALSTYEALTGGSGYDRADYILWNGSNLVNTGDFGNTNYVCILRLNTSLGVTGQNQFTGSVMDPIWAYYDGSNYYVCARKNGFYGFPAYTLKFNSSYALQWCSGLGNDVSGAASSPFFGAAIPIGTDVYSFGHTITGKVSNSSYSGLMWKANSSGTSQYQKVLGDNTGQQLTSIRNAAKTSDNKIIIGGWTRPTSGSPNQGYLAKIDPSGPSIDWEVLISDSGGASRWINSVKVDDDDNIFAAGYQFMIKLPPDGSITGTYGDLTIQSVSWGLKNLGTNENTDTQSLSTATGPTVGPTYGLSWSIANSGYSETITDL